MRQYAGTCRYLHLALFTAKASKRSASTVFVTGCAVTCDGLDFCKLLIINTCDGVTGVQGCARQGHELSVLGIYAIIVA
jgi:hypothetical protein